MNLRSRCEPTGRIMSAGCENSRTTTTKVMKMTEMIDSSDVLVSAAMFFSSASGSTAPTAMATSTTRLTHGCAHGGERVGLTRGEAGRGKAEAGGEESVRGQRGAAARPLNPPARGRTFATRSTPVTLAKTMDIVSPMPMRYAVIAP